MTARRVVRLIEQQREPLQHPVDCLMRRSGCPWKSAFPRSATNIARCRRSSRRVHCFLVLQPRSAIRRWGRSSYCKRYRMQGKRFVRRLALLSAGNR